MLGCLAAGVPAVADKNVSVPSIKNLKSKVISRVLHEFKSSLGEQNASNFHVLPSIAGNVRRRCADGARRRSGISERSGISRRRRDGRRRRPWGRGTARKRHVQRAYYREAGQSR